MLDYNNTFSMADKKFVDTVIDFFENNTQEYSMMEISKKTNLSKTQVSLSLKQLLSEKKVECLIKNRKKYYIKTNKS